MKKEEAGCHKGGTFVEQRVGSQAIRGKLK